MLLNTIYAFLSTLAAVCAFQFWQKANEDRQGALKDYISLCQKGGSKSFTILVDESGLQQPFEEGTLKSLVEDVMDYLTSIDDSKF